MPFKATVLQVMIASPGDVHQYRAIARDVMHEWNYMHSAVGSLVLMPVGWETHSSPELGSSAQDLINDRVLEDCDLLIGIFWTRLGTPTGRAASGTVEEIQRHVQAGKPAMLYFSQQPVAPDTLDAEQYAALKEFRSWCLSQGLVESFLNSEEFQSKLRRHVQIAIQKNDYLKAIVAAASEKTSDGTAPPKHDGAAALVSSLSPEAKALLLAAAEEKSGTIIAVNVMAGRLIQAGSKQLGNMEDRRSMAKWDYGLRQLLTLDLIDPMGNGREAFQLNERGYRVAEQISRSMPIGATR